MTTTTCTPDRLAAYVRDHLGGVISAGSHDPGGPCCLLEAVAGCEGREHTSDPDRLDRPDVRPLNDACWSSDVVRTEQMLRLAPLLASWPDWSATRRSAYVLRVALRTVREILPRVLRGLGLEEHALACESAEDLADAARAADAAADVAYAEASASDVAYIDAYAATVVYDAADAVPYVAKDKLLTDAVTIWAEETSR